MSYSSNQYNYATPPSSIVHLLEDRGTGVDALYFTLSNNTLDGSYKVAADDVGLWGTSVSDASGVLAEPLVVTVTDSMRMNAIRVQGSQYCYPVAFTVKFYNGTTLLRTITETANTISVYEKAFQETITVTSFVVTITKVSRPNSVAKLYSLYNLPHVSRSDTFKVGVREVTTITSDGNIRKHRTDTVKLQVREQSRIQNIIGVTTDRLRVAQRSSAAVKNIINVTNDVIKCQARESRSRVRNIISVAQDTVPVLLEEYIRLINVHTKMKEPFRHILGKVEITYTDPLLDSNITVTSSAGAYNSRQDQVLDGKLESDGYYFRLYNNDLSGNYRVMTEQSQIGWVSKEISDARGYFSSAPQLTISFVSRPIVSLELYFDASQGNIPRDFNVLFTHENGTTSLRSVADNSQAQVSLNVYLADVVSIRVTVTRVSRPSSPAIILEVPIVSTVLYKGYANESDIISIDLLEELTYEDSIEALGGVSANEVTVILDNTSRDFFFNSGSIVSTQLKRNRKIVPYLGVEVIPGEIEWHTLGTFWAYKWTVPVDGITATVLGYDTISLLGNTPFTEHVTQINKSIGDLIEYILSDATNFLTFLEHDIDDELYEVIIPYAWFENTTHADALRKISMCYPMHIYCDRYGRICAKPQRLHLDYYLDVWSNSTNVINKDYSSLYTALPNVVDVTVISPIVLEGEQLAQDEAVFSVPDVPSVTLTFNAPYISGISVDVDCDSSVQYTYTVYSWGIILTFTGRGQVRGIICYGTCVDITNSSVVTQRDTESIRLNGAIKREVESDFIQTKELADLIVSRIFSLSENDKFDATVNYRGDIALSINDPVRLADGIAPIDRYNIKRHQLSWSGFLTGTAELNT